MGLQDIVRWLLPREYQFYDFVEEQARIAHQAACALTRLGDSDEASEQVRDEVGELEHKGDDVLRALEDALARTFVTPIDREDLEHLARRLDDIVDLIDLTARSFVLFGVSRRPEPMHELIAKLIDGTELLAKAVSKLRSHEYAQILEMGRRIDELESEADMIFRNAIGALFRDPDIDAKALLREKEVLEDLENAMDRCNYVARTLTNVAVKNG